MCIYNTVGFLQSFIWTLWTTILRENPYLGHLEAYEDSAFQQGEAANPEIAGCCQANAGLHAEAPSLREHISTFYGTGQQ